MLICSLFLGLTACDNNEQITETTPIVSIDQDKMIAVLIDIHLAESLNQFRRRIEDTSFVLQSKEAYYEDILQIHQLSPKEFSDAFAYYTNDSEELAALYEKLIEQMSSLEADLKGEKQRKKKRIIEKKLGKK